MSYGRRERSGLTGWGWSFEGEGGGIVEHVASEDFWKLGKTGEEELGKTKGEELVEILEGDAEEGGPSRRTGGGCGNGSDLMGNDDKAEELKNVAAGKEEMGVCVSWKRTYRER